MYVTKGSIMSPGVDDKRLDDILADGIRGQTLEENKVTKERDPRVLNIINRRRIKTEEKAKVIAYFLG